MSSNSLIIFFNTWTDLLFFSSFTTGHFMTCWDLTPDLSSSGTSFSDLKSGNIRIELRFKTSKDHAIIMLLKFYWDAEMIMTHDRKIITDF
jgi:hypothetical protein